MDFVDIRKVLDDEPELLLFYAPLILVYLFHLDGHLLNLSLGVVSMFLPALMMAHSYYFNKRVFHGPGAGPAGYVLFFFLSAITYAVSFLYGLHSFYNSFDHGDLISVAIFAIGLFLVVLYLCSVLLSRWMYPAPPEMYDIPPNLRMSLVKLNEVLSENSNNSEFHETIPDGLYDSLYELNERLENPALRNDDEDSD